MGKNSDKAVKQFKSVPTAGGFMHTPEEFDTGIFEKQLGIEDALRKGLKKQEQTAEKAIGRVGEARDVSVAELRRKGAQSLASQRGLVSGGRGLSLARSTGKDIASREALMREGFAKQESDAEQAAADIGVQAKVQEGKLLQAQVARKEAAGVAAAEAENIIADETGSLYTTQADKAEMIRRLREKMNQQTNPYAAKVYGDAINKISRGYDAKGSFDIG